MIEVVKMEPVDEKKEVMQYLKDRQDVIAEMTKCKEYAGDVEFNRILADIMIARVFGEIDKFKETRQGSEFSHFSRLLIVALSNIELKCYPMSSSIMNNTTFGYDDESDSIKVTVITGGAMMNALSAFNEFSEIISIDKLKNLIDDLIRNKLDKTSTYLLMLDNGYENTGFGYTPAPSIPMPSNMSPSFVPPAYDPFYGAPTYGSVYGPTAGLASRGKSAISGPFHPKCNHVDENGKPTLYKRNPKNKTYRCSKCERALTTVQAEKLLKRYEESNTETVKWGE